MIYPSENPQFYLGCLYDSWTDRDTGEVKNTFSIVACPANPMTREIHNSGSNKHRMPVIIPENEIEKWIDPSLSKTGVQDMMKPFEENQMRAHTISKSANFSREYRNVPEIREHVEYLDLLK